MLQDIEHIGIRVSDLDCALTFYQILGFTPDPKEHHPGFRAAGLINTQGLRINIIHNADRQACPTNLLIDEFPKLAGITHVAFVVRSIGEIQRHLQQNRIPITEGPLKIGKRPVACFARDPDGTVLEFNEILAE